jgi:hypothetical protein
MTIQCIATSTLLRVYTAKAKPILVMHNQPSRQATCGCHISVCGEHTSVYWSRDGSHRSLLMCTQDLCATSEVNSDREEAKQESECSTSQPVAASSAGSTARPALQPATRSIEDLKSPTLKYALPPTEIHDGRLFRKVG